MKHTPASWKIEFGQNDAAVFTDGTIATIDDTLLQWKANARLIAAAPDLLDALERLFEHTAMVHNRWGENSNTEEADLAIRDARAAIAKAKGD